MARRAAALLIVGAVLVFASPTADAAEVPSTVPPLPTLPLVPDLDETINGSLGDVRGGDLSVLGGGSAPGPGAPAPNPAPAPGAAPPASSPLPAETSDLAATPAPDGLPAAGRLPPPPAPATGATIDSGSLNDAIASDAGRFGVPAVLVVAIAAYLLVQGRVDRGDPDFVDAPLSPERLTFG